MIAKYPGKCRYCGKSIEVGKDEYDLDHKNSYHVACFENQPPGPEAYELAERLGFCPHDERSIRAMAGQWVAMRSVYATDRGPEKRRDVGSAASRNENADLF